MQDCRTDCGCSRECLGCPRHALCLARARYCTTPHRNFDGPCQSASFARLGGRRATCRRAGRASCCVGRGCVGRRQWLSSVVPGWFPGPVASLCLVLVQVPGSGSPEQQQGRSISPVLILTSGSYLGCCAAEDSGKEAHREREKEEQERRASVACLPHAHAGLRLCLCLCCAVVPANVD